jgi:peptide/nickel transport system substrate-binding protein
MRNPVRSLLQRLGCKLLFVLGISLAVIGSANAQELRLAMSAAPTSLDPHFHAVASNFNVAEHMFETLVSLDNDGRIVPRLAESWRTVDPTTWEFKIRKGVKFHNGSEMTADDVVWSIARPATITTSPGPMTIYTRGIIESKVVDGQTVRLRTASPYPMLLNDLTAIYIVSKTATTGVDQAAFSNGLQGVVGTGQFRLVRFARDDRIELARHDNYWGGKPAWEKVTIRFLPADSARISALLAGEVDVLENVPTQDLKRVRESKNHKLFTKVSARSIFMVPTLRPASTPEITDQAGKPLDKNPLSDLRVRQAIHLALDRNLIRDRVMDGLSEPSAQLVPETLFGYNPSLKLPVPNLVEAKKLLTEAGYPNGFKMVVSGPSNRYINDDEIVLAVVSMLSRIGITATADVKPFAAYAGKAAKGEMSFGLASWAAGTGEVSTSLRALFHTPDRAKGFGTINFSGVSIPKVDAAIEEALRTIDDHKRLELLRDATGELYAQLAYIPVHLQVSTWAARNGLTMTPRVDERTQARDIRSN